MFDHVGVANSDLSASERFYRTVLSVLGVEPSYAGADMVGWDDWWIGAADREHPVTRGLHVGFRARDRAQVDAFWQVGVEAGYRGDGVPGPRPQYGFAYTAPSCSIPTATAPRRCTTTAKKPFPTAASTTCGSASATAGLPALLHDNRFTRRAAPDAR